MAIMLRGYFFPKRLIRSRKGGIMFRRSNSTRQNDDGVTDERSGDVRRDDDGSTGAHRVGGVDASAAQDARRDKFGGMNLGAAFFGWLVAIAVSILLTSIVGAIAAGVGSNAQITQSDAQKQAGTIGIVAGIVLLAVLMIGYYCGGYVAGRMSRFSGTKQGFGVWIIGLLVTIIAIVLGAVFGQQYDILSRVNLPRLPISSDALGTGGIIAAIAVLVGTLVAAIAGSSVGTHYHRRVDRAGYNV
jgi:amino acid transporter